jgi:hypothetical protein
MKYFLLLVLFTGSFVVSFAQSGNDSLRMKPIDSVRVKAPAVTVNTVKSKEADTSEVHLTKKQLLLGVFVDFSSNDNTRTSASGVLTGTSTLTLGGDLTLGYMLSDKIGLLVKGGYTESRPLTYINTIYTNGNNVTLKDDDISYIVTPMLRYYKKLNDDNYLFLQVRVPFSFGTYTTQIYDINKRMITEDTYNKFGVGAYLVPGFTSFISKRLAAEIAAGSFGYSYYDGIDSKGNTTHVGGFDALLYINSVSLGFVFYF